jgi:hypothetical protein
MLQGDLEPVFELIPTRISVRDVQNIETCVAGGQCCLRLSGALNNEPAASQNQIYEHIESGEYRLSPYVR